MLVFNLGGIRCETSARGMAHIKNYLTTMLIIAGYTALSTLGRALTE